VEVVRLGDSATPNGIDVGHVYATGAAPRLRDRAHGGGDLATPTSNAIYERIGYRRVA
jgi:hypothetical protein